MGRVLGIDLGTTNSTGAVMENGQPLMVPIEGARYTLPSVVSFLEDGRHFVGEAAKAHAQGDPANTVFAAKRLIGRAFEDPHTQQAMVLVPYRCVRGAHGDVRIAIRDRVYTIQEISALILAAIKAAAERHLGQTIKDSVITVPAYFNDRQRQATKDAGEIAGLNVLRVVNEPTAAALAYGFHQGAQRRIAVYDLGGGTFDVSILKVGGGVVEVLASAGDAFLGGHDFDSRIYQWLAQQVMGQHTIDLGRDLAAMHRLLAASEAAKIQLTDEDSVRVALPFLTTDTRGEAVHLDVTLERRVYEGLVEDLVQRTIVLFTDTLNKAGISPGAIDEVILVGGMTRMPRIRQRVQETVLRAPSEGVHPDLVVAVGAAMQGALLTEESASAVLLDATPHNLGILTVAGLAEVIIPKDSTVPCQVKRRFATAEDNQTEVKIVVYQGGSRHIDKNEILGEFTLENIQPAPRGKVQIDVTFSISAEGIVDVSAVDIASGKSHGIRISSSTSLDRAELTRMASQHRAQLAASAQQA